MRRGILVSVSRAFPRSRDGTQFHSVTTSSVALKITQHLPAGPMICTNECIAASFGAVEDRGLSAVCEGIRSVRHSFLKGPRGGDISYRLVKGFSHEEGLQ